MKLKLEFDMDNAAFDNDAMGHAAELLEKYAKWIRNGRTDALIHDYNGNPVGKYAITGKRG